MNFRTLVLGAVVAAGLLGCRDASQATDAGDDAGTPTRDAGGTVMDAGIADAGLPDARAVDAGVDDAGVGDAGPFDAGVLDSGTADAGTSDAGTFDAGTFDAGSLDAGSVDAGSVDAGPPDASVACVTPTMLKSTAVFAVTPSLAADSAGNAIVAWRETRSGLNSIWVARAAAGQPFGAPLLLTTDGGTSQTQLPGVVMNANGQALVWWFDNTVGSALHAVWGLSDGGFSNSQNVLAQPASMNAGEAQLALDALGNAVAAYAQPASQGSNATVWFNRAPVGGAFGTPVLIGTDGGFAELAFAPALGVADDGTAVVAWLRSNGGGNDVFGAVSYPDGGWLSPRVIDTTAFNTDGPSVSLQGSQALVLWRQFRGDGNWDVSSSWWDRAVGFTSESFVEQLDAGSTNTYIASHTTAALDGQGRALAAWNESSSSPFGSTVRVAHFAIDAGFSGQRDLSVQGGLALTPRVALGASGRVTIAWFDGATSWLASGYLGGSFAAPVDLQGTLAAPQFGASGAPQVVVLPSGKLVVVFATSNGMSSTRCQ